MAVPVDKTTRQVEYAVATSLVFTSVAEDVSYRFSRDPGVICLRGRSIRTLASSFWPSPSDGAA